MLWRSKRFNTWCVCVARVFSLTTSDVCWNEFSNSNQRKRDRSHSHYPISHTKHVRVLLFLWLHFSDGDSSQNCGLIWYRNDDTVSYFVYATAFPIVIIILLENKQNSMFRESSMVMILTLEHRVSLSDYLVTCCCCCCSRTVCNAVTLLLESLCTANSIDSAGFELYK